MYNGYFGFTQRPFPSVPLAEKYFPATTIEAARQTLARCVERAEGAALVVGPSGIGKTLLGQVLAAQFRDSSHDAACSKQSSTNPDKTIAVWTRANRASR
jgi:type II secretory pathway predicted ATPase ExeA